VDGRDVDQCLCPLKLRHLLNDSGGNLCSPAELSSKHVLVQFAESHILALKGVQGLSKVCLPKTIERRAGRRGRNDEATLEVDQAGLETFELRKASRSQVDQGRGGVVKELFCDKGPQREDLVHIPQQDHFWC